MDTSEETDGCMEIVKGDSDSAAYVASRLCLSAERVLSSSPQGRPIF